jgi:ABC-type sulfate/molybdate transport systems ATPase subunit
LSRVNKLKQSGTSLILVSHIAQQIIQNTNKCIFLQNGQIEAIGPTVEVYRLYENQNDDSLTNEDQKQFGGIVKINGAVQDISLKINTNVKEDVNLVSAYEEITFVTKFKCSKNLNLGITIVIHDVNGTRIAVFNNLQDKHSINKDSEGFVSFHLWIEPLQLISGDYTVVLVVQDGPEYLFRNSVKRFKINTKGQENDLYKVGLIKPKYEWK